VNITSELFIDIDIKAGFCYDSVKTFLGICFGGSKFGARFKISHLANDDWAVVKTNLRVLNVLLFFSKHTVLELIKLEKNTLFQIIPPKSPLRLREILLRAFIGFFQIIKTERNGTAKSKNVMSW